MSKTLSELFEAQGENQRNMLVNGMYSDFVSDDVSGSIYIFGLPIDNPSLASYHIQQLVSEIGEVLDADKRWKNIRNTEYNKDAKLEELADCFIVLMNICMYSDIDYGTLEDAICKKISVIHDRIKKEAENK